MSTFSLGRELFKGYTKSQKVLAQSVLLALLSADDSSKVAVLGHMNEYDFVLSRMKLYFCELEEAARSGAELSDAELWALGKAVHGLSNSFVIKLNNEMGKINEREKVLESSDVYKALVIVLDWYIHPTESEIRKSEKLQRAFCKESWEMCFEYKCHVFSEALKLNFDWNKDTWIINEAFFAFTQQIKWMENANLEVIGLIKGKFLSTVESYVSRVESQLKSDIDILSVLTPDVKDELVVNRSEYVQEPSSGRVQKIRLI